MVVAAATRHDWAVSCIYQREIGKVALVELTQTVHFIATSNGSRGAALFSLE